MSAWRECVRPDCTARIDMVAVYEHRADPAGWRIFQTVILGHLCPVHAPAVTEGGHMPAWSDPGAPKGMTGIECGCGWNWQPAIPATQGDHQRQWVGHLMDRDPHGRAA